jgi:hypothetical protein
MGMEIGGKRAGIVSKSPPCENGNPVGGAADFTTISRGGLLDFAPRAC